MGNKNFRRISELVSKLQSKVDMGRLRVTNVEVIRFFERLSEDKGYWANSKVLSDTVSTL